MRGERWGDGVRGGFQTSHEIRERETILVSIHCQIGFGGFHYM